MKTQKEMMLELYQAVVGIPESPNDNGLIGEVAKVKVLLLAQNSRVRKNEEKISKNTNNIKWIIRIGSCILTSGAIGGGLWRLLW